MRAALAQAAQAVQEDAGALPARQQTVAIVLAVAILVAVLELVRERKLREEYSVLWILTAFGLFLLALNYGFLLWLTELLGAALPTSTLFFGGLVFVILLSLQFSVRLSRLTYRMRVLTRKVAMLETDLRERAGREARETEAKR